MASRVCWKCTRASHMTLIEASVTALRQLTAYVYEVQGTFLCDNCGNPSVGVARVADDPPRGVAGGLDAATDIAWIPQRAVGRSFPDVPAEVSSAASEA